ncbi:hypothetical protein [Bacteroides neonati]|uniref:hypothetical protein n=1 Tax=Bacteroides neonati TaxID=1347393 RepID=UPI001CA33645|nr:hypothetical protein [Bacteroides neonati]
MEANINKNDEKNRFHDRLTLIHFKTKDRPVYKKHKNREYPIKNRGIRGKIALKTKNTP